jgi:hypothetical protein
MLIDSHTLLFFGGSVLRIDELEINPALKLISYDRREEGEMSRKENILSVASQTEVYMFTSYR